MDKEPFVGIVVVREGKIALLSHGSEAPAGLEHAPRVDTHGYIFPGLIDAHNHPMHNMLGLWRVPRQFPNRYEWRNNEPTYKRDVRGVHYRFADTLHLAAEIGVWAKVRALAGGTVALQGWELLERDQKTLRVGVGTLRGELGRIVEDSNNNTAWIGGDAVNVPSDAELAKRDSLRALSPWIMHLGEGRQGDNVSVTEIGRVRAADVLNPRAIVIHGTAMTRADFDAMAAAQATLVWSPTSNGLLYGETTPVELAKAAGVRIALGSDWGPSGSKNLLGELKTASLWNKAHNNVFSDRELADMVTRSPAHALGWDTWAGHIAVGTVADLLVVDSLGPDPYHALVSATEENVRLVTVDGLAVYGDDDLFSAVTGGRGESVGTLAGRTKVIPYPKTSTKPTRPTLAAARNALTAAYAALPAPGGHLDSLFTATDESFFATLASTPWAPSWVTGLNGVYHPRDAGKRSGAGTPATGRPQPPGLKRKPPP